MTAPSSQRVVVLPDLQGAVATLVQDDRGPLLVLHPGDANREARSVVTVAAAATLTARAALAWLAAGALGGEVRALRFPSLDSASETMDALAKAARAGAN